MISEIISTIGAGIRGIGGFLLGMVKFIWNSAAHAAFVAFNLGVVSILRAFIPMAWRMAAFSTAPVLSTIAPGVIAAALTRIELEPFRDRNAAIYEIFPDENALVGYSAIGSATALTAATTTNMFTPAFIATLTGPASWSCLAATAAVATAGDFAGVTSGCIINALEYDAPRARAW